MFRNYLVVALRNFGKQKLNTFINVLGLAIGTACCLLLLLFVKNELSYDTFHEKKNRLYRGWAKEVVGQQRTLFHTLTPFPFGDALKENFPEVEEVSLWLPVGWKLNHGDRQVPETVHLASSGFFKMFSFPIVEGDVTRALESTDDIIITKSCADRYFGKESAIGKTLSFIVDDKTFDFEVKAVVSDPPTNSSLKFQFIVSEVLKEDLYEARMLDSWFAILGETYVLLREGTLLTDLEKKFPSLVERVVDVQQGDTYSIGLQPMLDIHVNPDFPVGLAPVTNPKYAYILGGIAALIVIIACINFVTLSISQSINRAKEVGMRKVAGAFRFQLIQQYLSETILLVIFGLLGGILFANLALPPFNLLSGTELTIEVSGFLLGMCLALVIIIGVLAGSYPAMILSGLKPVAILKGSTAGVGGRSRVRKILLGFQFFFSLGLISCTIIMKDQLNYLKNKDLGFNQQQVMTVPLRAQGGRIGQTIKNGMERAENFKTELSAHTAIHSVAAASYLMGESWIKIGYTSQEDQYKEFFLNVVTPEYLSAMEIKLAEGRDFAKDNLADFNQSVIVNEAFLRDLNWTSGVGKRIPGPQFGDHEIIGVMRDFNYASLYGAVAPAVIVLDFAVIAGGFESINLSSSPSPKLIIRYDAAQTQEVTALVKTAWDKIIGNDELSYGFLNDRLEAQYRSEQNLDKIVSAAAVLAVILGSLGLFAFSSLSIQSKLKELSIRKVMGASENGLFFLVSKEYIILLLVSLVISAPVSWMMMDKWLAGFAYRIQLHPFYFLITGIISVVIALATVSYYALKAARTQPVRNLRNE